MVSSDGVGEGSDNVAGRIDSADRSAPGDAAGTRAARHVNRNEVEGLSGTVARQQ